MGLKKKTMSNTTQLTSADSYNTKNMRFSKPVAGTAGFRRINISTKNPDGTYGDLILLTEELFSFGPSQNKEFGTDKLRDGHTLPLCLWSREGATKSQLEWIEKFGEIVETCKKYLIDHREELELYDLEMAHLKSLNPLFYKKEKGKPIEGRGPTLYAKLIESKKLKKVLSLFYDENGEPIDPLTIIGKYCYATCAIKIESISLGSKISLQVKVYQANIRLAEGGIRELIPRAKSTTKVSVGDSNPLQGSDDETDELARLEPAKPAPTKVVKNVKSAPPPKEDSDAGSIVDDSGDEVPAPVQPPKVVSVPKRAKKTAN